MASKVKVALKHAPGLSEDEASSLKFGQAHWWLRNEGDGEFVKLPRRVRGDAELDLVVALAPGSYLLGVGPVGSGVREEIVVEAAAPAPAPAGNAPVADAAKVTGKRIVITGDLAALERDEAKEYLTGLGARVTGSVSGKTDILLVGTEPGAKKIEKAESLGTQIMSEAELCQLLGLGDGPLGGGGGGAVGAAPVDPAKPSKAPKIDKFITALGLHREVPAAVEKLAGVPRFRDLGLDGNYLWGISIGPRGGEYEVFIDLGDRPRYAVKCRCRDYNPCKHAKALLVTAQRHFVPPAPVPPGHRDAANETFDSIFE